MVMKAGSMDLRKLAEQRGLSQNKLRKYTSEMASVMRWVKNSGWRLIDLTMTSWIIFRAIVYTVRLWY